MKSNQRLGWTRDEVYSPPRRRHLGIVTMFRASSPNDVERSHELFGKYRRWDRKVTAAQLPKHQVSVWDITVIDAACHYSGLAIARHRSDLNLEGNRSAAQDDATQELE
jgi:hypothetical protein